MHLIKYLTVLFLGMLLGIALWMPEINHSYAAIPDVPGDIFVEVRKPEDWDDSASYKLEKETSIKIRSKYLSVYRIGGLTISADNRGILVMMTRIDQ